jgi:ribosomal protein S27AE
LFDNFGVDHCRIILLETFPCQSKDELTSREAFYIRSMPNVNKIIPHRTRAQYREDNQEDILRKRIEYYEINKDSINKRRRECGNVICKCGSSILRRNVLQHIKTQKHISALSAIGDVVVDGE